MHGWCREINFNGYYSVGWREDDQLHGFNIYCNESGEHNEHGLYEKNQFRSFRPDARVSYSKSSMMA